MDIYGILINKQNKISADFEKAVKFAECRKTDGACCRVETQTLKMFQKLQQAATLKGLYVGIDYAYRSVAAQRQIYIDFCRVYGREYADAVVAPVGASEHQSGLAIDVAISLDGGKTFFRNKKDELLACPQAMKALGELHEMLVDFGFILRYPEGKEKITGYGFEPWHIRYVGPETARSIYRQNITLEEYCRQQQPRLHRQLQNSTR